MEYVYLFGAILVAMIPGLLIFYYGIVSSSKMKQNAITKQENRAQDMEIKFEEESETKEEFLEFCLNETEVFLQRLPLFEIDLKGKETKVLLQEYLEFCQLIITSGDQHFAMNAICSEIVNKPDALETIQRLGNVHDSAKELFELFFIRIYHK